MLELKRCVERHTKLPNHPRSCELCTAFSLNASVHSLIHDIKLSHDPLELLAINGEDGIETFSNERTLQDLERHYSIEQLFNLMKEPLSVFRGNGFRGNLVISLQGISVLDSPSKVRNDLMTE